MSQGSADYEALGVYDPADPHATRRLELLEYLVSLGATTDDLIQYRDDLPGAATVVASRGGKALTLSEAVKRAGIPEDKLLQIIRAAGFAAPGPDDRVISEQLAGVAASTAAAEAIFGEEAALQLVRVMGSAMSRLADAAVSAFLVNIDPGILDADPVGLRAARASAEAVALVPIAGAMLETLLREHIIGARRTSRESPSELGYETQQTCVGFLDLVGSTALARRLSTRELGAVLTEFEHTATDAITAGGGRVVKLIGDAVMYVAAQEPAAVDIALNVIAAMSAHPRLPPVRGGVAAGGVLARNGDIFGPVVNLAARAVKVAGAGEVVVPVALAAAAGIEAEPLGRHQLSGFDDDLELCRLMLSKPRSAQQPSNPGSRPHCPSAAPRSRRGSP
ncbi:MAG: adenylate/guanylate cyclase domain-containing protein [Solirubrobacteraceae bacterium]